ncbi:MAG: aldo/keto reductase [Casimicrobiaceae bacterium]
MAMPTITFPDGAKVPALGFGTWRMGESARRRAAEVAAVRRAVALGMTLLDIAEMYGDGEAESIVGEAIAGCRDDVFIVSKVYPQNAGAKSAIAACERSMKRLGTDRIDLYLLHWRGRIPLTETVGAFERLRREGKIVRWGVSNFDVADMDELWALPDGERCAANQVLYHLGERGVEWRLAPNCRARGVPLMAYSPVGQGALLAEPKLAALARKAHATPAQLALAFLLAQPGVIVIPKATQPAHIVENRKAAELTLDAATRGALDAAFPPPSRATPLVIN